MRYGIFTVLLMMALAGSAFAEYQFEVTTQREPDADGVLECADGRLVTVAFEMDGAGRSQYPKAPDENCISTTDLQEWFVGVESALGHGYYLVSFLASAAGLEAPKKGALQYWLRYSKDGVIWSGWSAMSLMRPVKPTGR